MVGVAVGIAVAFTQTDGVKDFAVAILFDMGFGQMEVVFQIFFLPDIPYQRGGVIIVVGALRQEVRLDRLNEIFGVRLYQWVMVP